MNTCSIGIELKLDCHKNTYCSQSEISEIVNEDKYLLTLRTGIRNIHLHTICTHHRLQFINYYSTYHKSCCDPFSIHSKIVKGNLTTVTLEHNQLDSNLIPGKKICFGCVRKIKNVEEVDKRHDPDYISPDNSVTQIDTINPCLVKFGVSPIKRSSSMSMLQIDNKIKKKVKLLNESLNASERDELQISMLKSYALDFIVEQLKQKFRNEINISQKIKLLTLAPVHCTIQETINEFKTTQYMVKQARALQDVKGILGERSTDIRNPKKLTTEVVNQVVNFYEDDSNSRLLPGAKDYISIKTVDGRQHIQKRLILCNLSELYQKWLEESKSNGVVKVGLTSFALLRPQHCIVAGKSGTHTVCVCIDHQNPNLMVKSLKNEIKSKDLMALAVCSIENKPCMFHECEKCPGKKRIEKKLNELLGDSANEITYKQWLKTDRCSLETIVKSPDEFLEELTDKLYNLTKHHYVSKSQTFFLNQLKENMKPNECIMQMDFAENFSFIIQDEVQSSYFSKNQATLHPFVIYVQSLNGNQSPESKCYCVISDNLIHNTEAVFSYVSKIIPILKEEYPQVQKINYFTDGASSQYKNRFNLKNLCFHEKDYGLKADWHFFGTAHGKSACDGIGGTVKRVIHNLSLQRPIGNQILTPRDMFLVAKEKIKNIRYI